MRVWWFDYFRLGLTLLSLAGLVQPSTAASFWLEHGYTRLGVCPGETNHTFKSANIDSSLLITALIDCTDIGDSYRIEFQFLKVQLNPRFTVSRPEVFHFDWVGLAIYRPADASQESIDWLYDDALPISGELPQGSTATLAFGNLSFTYPKTVVEEATHFTLYLTFRGRLEQFGLL